MASIRQDKHGYWHLSYYQDKKRIRKECGKGAEGRRIAELALAQITIKINKKKIDAVIRGIEDIPIDQFLTQYLEYSEANKPLSSYERDIITIEKLYPMIQGKTLSQIKAVDIETYKAQRSQKVAKITVNRELSTIKAVFNMAVEWGYLSRNPLNSVKRFTEPRRISPDYRKKSENKVISPDTPYTNIKHIEDILIRLKGEVYWIDKHFNKRAFRLIADIADSLKIKELTIISGEPRNRASNEGDYERLKLELQNKGIKLEWRIVTNKQIINKWHDRWLFDDSSSWNIPPVNTIFCGQESECLKTNHRPDIQKYMDNSIPILDKP